MFAVTAALQKVLLLCRQTNEQPERLRNDAALPPQTELHKQWRRSQITLAGAVVETDDHPEWTMPPANSTTPGAAAAATESEPKGLKLIGGVDISFIKGNDVDALAMLVVLSYPELKVVHQSSAMIKLTAPYISGFLAFREAPHLLALLNKLKADQPELYPQVLFVDGNGVLHPARCGLASHLGVVAKLPTIGIGKKLINVDGLAAKFNKKKVPPGQTHEVLVGDSGRTWGAACVSKGSGKPVYVSVGHRVGLATAIALTRRVSLHRIPEPVRQADLLSRDALRIAGI